LNFNPQNILIINFGQIGDVILSLPALRAVRMRFPAARITALVGKSGAEIVGISGFADEKIVVDRVKLRDGNKLVSIKEIFKISKDVRRRKFDFVIDLHSLYETNLLGFLSGAPHRLYANRENRSLDFLGNFNPKPPSEDKSKHLTEHYLSVLQAPLGIEDAKPFAEVRPRKSDLETIETILREYNVADDKKLVGLFPGAGHRSRRWHLENFARLAAKIASDKSLQPIVFLGPEEKDLRSEVKEKFPADAIVLDNLTLLEFAAALSKLQILISNDTGAIHIGAVAGTSIVLILDRDAPLTFLPLTEKLRVVRSGKLDEITVEEVFAAATEILYSEENLVNEISNYKEQPH
jgi:ADP-heptose:LPS heptosyltransferase